VGVEWIHLAQDRIICLLLRIRKWTLVFEKIISCKGRLVEIRAPGCFIRWKDRKDSQWIGILFPVRIRTFSVLHSAQIHFGVYPASHSMGKKGFSPKGKAAGACSWPLISIYWRSVAVYEVWEQISSLLTNRIFRIVLLTLSSVVCRMLATCQCASERSWDKLSRYRFSWFSSVFKRMLRWFPNFKFYSVLLMQPSWFRSIEIKCHPLQPCQNDLSKLCTTKPLFIELTALPWINKLFP
jgi:hypothetical protein